MGLIDFVKGAYDKIVGAVSDTKDTIEAMVRETKADNNISGGLTTKGNGISDIINLQNLPADQINSDNIKTMENIFKDNLVTDSEKSVIAGLPEAYKNIAIHANNMRDLQNLIYTDKFINADKEEAAKLKQQYAHNLERYNYNMGRLDVLTPGHREEKKEDAMLVSNIRNSYNPIMKRVEDNFGSNSDMSLTFNTITADSASDVVNLRKQVREAGRLEDETAQKDLADIERKKKQRDELIANKAINNKSVVKSWADAFDIAEDDETIKSLSKEITDLSEKIRADNMWFSTKRSFEEGKIVGGAYKGLETANNFVVRALNEGFQNVFTTKATDLSDLEYASVADDSIGKYAGKVLNGIIRNGGEISSLLIPVSAPLKAVAGIAGLSRLASAIGAVGKGVSLWRGTVGVDSVFDSNFSSGLTDRNTTTNIVMNILGEVPGIVFQGVKALKAAKNAAIDSKNRKMLYEAGNIVHNVDGKDITTNLFDIIGKGKESVGANDIIKIAADGGIVDLKAFDTNMKTSINNVISLVKGGDNEAVSTAKTFVKNVIGKFAESGAMDYGTAATALKRYDSLMSTPEGVEEVLSGFKKAVTGVANEQIKSITDNIKTIDSMYKQIGSVPVEQAEDMLNYKQKFIDGVSSYFSGKSIPADASKAINPILEKINSTGKIADSDVMGIIREFNKTIGELPADEYIKRLTDFTRTNLKYVPDGMKSIEAIKSIANLADTKFVQNVKNAGLSVKFDNLKKGIGGTFKNSVAIISTLKDFYKNPEDFVVGFVHELTHGLLSKNSGLYDELVGEYTKQVDAINNKFSNLYEGFDIKNINKDTLIKEGFSQEEIDYIIAYSHRFKNADEYIAYNLSEALVGKKPSDAIELLKQKVDAVSKSVFGDADIDAAFRIAGDKLINGRYAVGSMRTDVAVDIENYLYASNGKRIFTNDMVDMTKTLQDVGSIRTAQEIIKNTDPNTLAVNLKDVDSQLYKTIMETIDFGDETLQEFVKQSIFNGMFCGHRGYDAVISGGMFEIWGDLIKYTDLPDISNAIQLQKYVDDGMGQMGAIRKKIGMLLNSVPFGSTKYKSIENALIDINAVTEYYMHIDVLSRVKQLRAVGEDVGILDGMKNFALNRIEKIKTSRGASVKDLYGVKAPKSVLNKGLSDIINDLSKTIGGKGVQLNDYLLRTLMNNSKGIVTTKMETLGYGLWNEFVKAMDLPVVSKQTPQDVLNVLAKANYIKQSEIAGTLYGLGKIFGVDDVLLKNDKVKKNILQDVLNGTIDQALVKYNKKGVVTSVRDVLDFLNMSDYVPTAENIADIFDNIYGAFDYKIAEQIANRVAGVFTAKGASAIPAKVVGEALNNSSMAAKNLADQMQRGASLIADNIPAAKKNIGELTDLARADVSISPDGQFTIRGENGLVYAQKGNVFQLVVDNSQAIGNIDSIKGVVTKSAVYDIATKNIYNSLGLKRGNAKGVAKYMNDAANSKMLDNSGVDKFGIPIDDLKKLNDIPNDTEDLAKYIEQYSEAYKKCIDNFGVNDDVTKYVGAKMYMAEQYKALKDITDDVPYYRALAEISGTTVTMLRKKLDELDDAIAKGDIKKSNDIIKSIEQNFTKGVTRDDLAKNVEGIKKQVKAGEKYIIPGANQPRAFSFDAQKTMSGVKTFAKNIRSSVMDMSREAIKMNSKYMARLGEGNRVLTEMNEMASNGLFQKTYAFEQVKNLSAYQKKQLSPNVASRIWRQFDRAKERFTTDVKDSVILDIGTPNMIKDGIASSIASRFGLDKNVVKEGISVDLVKTNIYNVSYKDVNGNVVSYYINSKIPEEIGDFYRYSLTRDEVLEGKVMEVGLGNDMTYKVNTSGDAFNGILDQQVLDTVDNMDYDSLNNGWAAVAKDVMGEDYYQNMMKDKSVFGIFSFLMENQAILKESATEAYAITGQLNRAVTNSLKESANKISAITAESGMLKEFGQVYNANKELVKALIIGKRIISNGTAIIKGEVMKSIDDVVNAFKSGTYTLDNFVTENAKSGLGIADIDDINSAIKYGEKQIGEVGQYAGVKYFLDKTYGPNLLMDYKGKSTEIFDDLMGYYADEFASIYDNMGVTIPASRIKEEFVNYYLRKKSLNVVGFAHDMTSFKIYESITESLKKSDVIGSDRLMTINEAMIRGSLSDAQRTRIYDDLMGKSLWGDKAFFKFLAKVRRETSALQLGRWSPKAWVIAGQNLLSNTIEIFSKRQSLTNVADELVSLNERLLKNSHFKQNISRLYGPNGDLLNRLDLGLASQGKNLEVEGVSVPEKVVNRFVGLGDKMVQKAYEATGGKGGWTDFVKENTKLVPPNKQGVVANLMSPIGGADEITKGKTLNNLAYNKVFDEICVSVGTINDMVDEIDELDKLLAGKTGLDRVALNARKEELIRTVNRIYDYASREALVEYNTIYKAGAVAGLMKNGFSRWSMFTYFSSWGSKKSGEYLYNAFYKPFANAYVAYRLGGTGAMSKALMHELLTNQHINALMKQSLYAARSLYQLQKDENLDTVGEDNFLRWFMTVSPFGQALSSFFITRAIGDTVSGYRAGKRNDLSTMDSIKYGIYQGLYTVVGQFMKDIKFFAAPIAQGFQEGGSAGDAMNVVAQKIWYNMSNSMYYSMYDMYKGLPTNRLDSNTMYPFLDLVIGDTVTKYKGDMDKAIDDIFLRDTLEQGKGELKLDWVKKITSALAGMPTGYSKMNVINQIKDIKKNDMTYQELVEGNMKGLGDGAKSKVMEYFLTHDWAGEFDMKNTKGKTDGKVALIMNELQSKGVDTSELSAAINDGDMKSAQKSMAILQAAGMTKADSTTVLAYMANKVYDEIGTKYRKMGFSLKDKATKDMIYKDMFDTIIPTAISVDKEVHATVVERYFQETYGDVIEGVKSLGEGGSDSDVFKYFKLGLLAEVADTEAVDFRKDLMFNAGQRILKDTPDEYVAKATADMFSFVDNMESVSESGKMVAKASMLYGNLDRMKLLLNSKYAPSMQDEMLKLSDIIWKTNDALQVNPDLLNAVGGGGRVGKIKKPKDFTFQKQVIKDIKDLKDSIPKKLKQDTLNLTYKRINAKLEEISLPKLKIEKDEFSEMKLTPIRSAGIETAGVRVAEGKATSTKPKIRVPKIVARKEQSIARAKPPKIQRAKLD